MRTAPSLVTSLVALAAAIPMAGAAEGAWTGAHVGIDVGMGQHTASITDVDYDYFGSTMTMSDKSAIAGLRAGYDHQFGSLVVGADVTWQKASFESSERYSNDVDIKNTMESLYALRLRAGMAVDYSLVYILGGVAKGNFEHDWNDDGSPNNSVRNVENDEMGSVLGFGIETLVEKIAIRGEIARYDFPSVSKDTPNGSQYDFADQLVTFTVGASYRF